MSKAIVYDRMLKNHMVVNDDGSINVKGLELQGGDISVNVDDIQVDVPERKLVMTRYYKNNQSMEYDLNGEHHFIAVANDSREDSLELVINGMEIDVLPWETFEAEFEPFTEFKIKNENEAKYRCAVFQKKVVGSND